MKKIRIIKYKICQNGFLHMGRTPVSEYEYKRAKECLEDKMTEVTAFDVATEVITTILNDSINYDWVRVLWCSKLIEVAED